MFVMMPQVHCVDGSRVKNIKKQFEVLSNESTVETDNKISCHSSSSNNGKASERQPSKNGPFSVTRETEESKLTRSIVNSKENSLKNDKCNIKRSPAFRCDRIVKGKNVTGQSKDKHTSVEDKVKLFEVREPAAVKNPVLVESQKSGESKVTPRAGDINKTNSCAESFLNREVLGIKAGNNYEPQHVRVSENINVFETKVLFPLSFKPRNDDLDFKRSVHLKSGCEIAKDNTQVCIKAVSSSKNTLNDILKSPLPRGPPPRKPPRTFAHSGSQTVVDRLPKPSGSVKECAKDTLRRLSADSITPTPTLVRSKTESQIELRNKLETALSKMPPSDHSPQFAGRSSKLETNRQNVTKSCKTRPASKPDISPSSLLVGCLSLGCVSSHQYEEVGANRQCQFSLRPSDRREDLDIRSSLIDPTSTQNTSLSLIRSHSEDHIYAVPFGETKSKESRIPKLDSLPECYSKILKKRSEDASKGLAEIGSSETNGLHYLCTPIVSYGQLHDLNLHSEHALAVDEHSNLLRFGADRQKCPSLHFTAEVRGTANLTQVGNIKVHAALMNQTQFDTLELGIPEVKLEVDETVSGLSVSIGKEGFSSGSKSSLCSPSTETEEENGEEEHDAVTEEMVQQRKGYVRRVCSIFQKLQMENSPNSQGPHSVNFHGKNGPNSKVSASSLLVHNVPSSASGISPSSSTHVQPPPVFQHLFECVLLVGLTLSSDQEEGKSYVPYIQSKYPSDVLVPSWIEHLCFPDAFDWPISNSVSSSKSCMSDDLKKKDSKSGNGMVSSACRGRTYSLVITGPDGSRRFGYCRRVLPEGGSLCLPLNYCIISPYRANGFYFKVLAELESRHGQPESERTAFLQELYSCSLPGPGQVPCPPSSSSSPSPFIASLKRPVDTRLEETDVMELFCCLEVGVFLDVFASLLLERKVLLTSKSLSKLSSCVEALQSVLYPFSWQHTFIPVLPLPMLDICHAPTPYIIGVLKGCNGQIPNIALDEGIMVDLDTSQYLQRVGDEGSILPSRIKRALQSALRIVSGLNTSPQPYLSRKSSNPDGATSVCNILVSEAFLRTFLMIVGHYPNHIVVQQDGRKIFERESFIKAMEFPGVRMFLEWFTETAMFSAFLNSCLGGGGSESRDGVFEQRALKYCEESEKDALLFLKNYKAMTKKNKTFGDRLKDWAPFA